MKSFPTLQPIGWRSLLVIPFMTLLVMCSGKDPAPDASEVTGEVYTTTTVDQQPVPQGGQAGLLDYLMKNLRYPAEAQRAGIQGKVIVGFVVTNVGRIADVKVNQSVGGGCDEEAVRLVKQMSNWTPGQKNGQPVNVRTTLPLSFTML